MHIGGSFSNQNIVSDLAAKEFFGDTLSKQKNLTHISLPDLNLKGNTISTLIYQVILKAPPNGPDTSMISDKDSRPNFSGCYKILKVLNISGNCINDSHFDAKTLYSIFDFLESLEELNIERLKFDDFKTFKK